MRVVTDSILWMVKSMYRGRKSISQKLTVVERGLHVGLSLDRAQV